MLPAQLYTYIMLTLTSLLLMMIIDIKNRGYMIYRTIVNLSLFLSNTMIEKNPNLFLITP